MSWHEHGVRKQRRLMGMVRSATTQLVSQAATARQMTTRRQDCCTAVAHSWPGHQPGLCQQACKAAWATVTQICLCWGARDRA